MVDFKNSKTKKNLMKAFAGESQARNRYNLAQKQAENAKLYVLADLFRFTADQAKVHADIFFKQLQSETGETVHIEGGYPVDVSNNAADHLKFAHHNEYQEYEDIYPEMSEVARAEGFPKIAQDFANIAKIEKSHGDRFERFRKLMDEGMLFSSHQLETWVCLNCGYIFEGTQAPEKCPVCGGEQGYFIRLSMADWGIKA